MEAIAYETSAAAVAERSGRRQPGCLRALMALPVLFILGSNTARHSREPAEWEVLGRAPINSVLARHCCVRRRGSRARVSIICVYVIDMRLRHRVTFAGV